MAVVIWPWCVHVCACVYIRMRACVRLLHMHIERYRLNGLEGGFGFQNDIREDDAEANAQRPRHLP